MVSLLIWLSFALHENLQLIMGGAEAWLALQLCSNYSNYLKYHNTVRNHSSCYLNVSAGCVVVDGPKQGERCTVSRAARLSF